MLEISSRILLCAEAKTQQIEKSLRKLPQEPFPASP